MKNGKLRRLGGLLALLLVLTCLLSMSAFAGANERYGYTQLNENQQELYDSMEYKFTETRSFLLHPKE